MKGNEPALIAGAVAGLTLAELASLSGLAVSTVQRRLREPEIAAAIVEARADLRRATLGRMLSARDLALDRVTTILGGADDVLALRAAQLVLSTASRLENTFDLAERVAALEAEADQGVRPSGADWQVDAPDDHPVGLSTPDGGGS